jgi:hypothetical protein
MKEVTAIVMAANPMAEEVAVNTGEVDMKGEKEDQDMVESAQDTDQRKMHSVFTVMRDLTLVLSKSYSIQKNRRQLASISIRYAFFF